MAKQATRSGPLTPPTCNPELLITANDATVDNASLLNRVARFAAAFVVLYGLMLAPWPGWNAAYGLYLRALGSACFAREDSSGLVQFRPAQQPPRPEIDTEIVVAASAQPDTSGRIQGRILGLDTRGVGWVPTALLVALILASPVPWPRRLQALGAGLVLIHLYFILVLAVYLWSESGGLIPTRLIPLSPKLAEGLEETLVTQMGPSFVIPAILWLAVTFRREDRARLTASSTLRTGQEP